ncbi:hypothetical protein KC19_12G011400 [Ceratodon purpureus]|uniref:TBC1 domain family member 15 n=1 Tax=Ceratodon purpureus TaxID=3225 RepID=A0A8T0G4Q9_CERPU|nr:hypothetical protein KC19_12G011400 [Ceratodon purpureus]KAG0553437.1 hypothetical protein KC19_12G011400 [Ceratodon purpureus]
MGGQSGPTMDSGDFIDESDYKSSAQAVKSSKTIQGGSSSLSGSESGKMMVGNGGPDSYEVVFVKDNVSVHPTQNASERISGRLRLIKQGASLFMTWIPYTVKGGGRQGSSIMKSAEKVSLAEMRSIRRHTPPFGLQYIIIVLTSGLAFPPLYFHTGGVREFLSTLRNHALLVRSNDDSNVYLVNDVQDPLQRSLTSLELTEVTPVAVVVEPPPIVTKKDETVQPVEESPASTSMQTSVYRQGPRREASREIINVLEKFSMVTKFARDTTAHLFGESRLLGNSEMDFDRGPMRLRNEGSVSKSTGELPPVDGAQEPVKDGKEAAAKDEGKDTKKAQDEESEKQKRIANEEASTNVGSFELVDGTKNDTPALVWGRARPPPLGHEEWVTFLDREGRVVDSKALKKRVFHGGVEPNLRPELWKFLLGHYKFDSTYAERNALVSSKREEYKVLQAQWKTVSEDQAKRFAKFRERKHRVEKDVIRTDRTIPFYEGDDNRNVELLRDILVTYSFYNFDLGYCQGMSDLLSPILYVMEDESEAFWCFAALMERMAPNFHRDQNGMQAQLSALSKLVQLLDTPLHDYFKQNECLNYFFCFRWILICFKREFDYNDVLRLWEVLWSHYLSEHFHLYMCVAILKRHRRKIMDEQMEFDTLLKFINELSGHIELESTLRDTEALCLFAGEKGAACIPPGTPPSLPVVEVDPFAVSLESSQNL